MLRPATSCQRCTHIATMCRMAECTAIVLAMRAIRTVRPDAKLVQTEDLGKTFSTPLLSYQAELENERRWLSLDLLCGRVDPHHPWHEILDQKRHSPGGARVLP